MAHLPQNPQQLPPPQQPQPSQQPQPQQPPQIQQRIPPQIADEEVKNDNNHNENQEPPPPFTQRIRTTRELHRIYQTEKQIVRLFKAAAVIRSRRPCTRLS